MAKTVYPNAEIILDLLTGKELGEVYSEGPCSWGFLDYNADMGYTLFDTREEALTDLLNPEMQAERAKFFSLGR